MQIQLALPDDVAQSLEKKWGNLERKLLEMLVVEAYLEGSISVGKVRELLGMSTRLEVDAFLKAKGVDLQYDETDYVRDALGHGLSRIAKPTSNCDEKGSWTCHDCGVGYFANL